MGVWKRFLYGLIKRFCVFLKAYMGVSKRLYMGVSTHTYDDVLTHLHTCVLQRRPLIVAERQHIAHGQPDCIITPLSRIIWLHSLSNTSARQTLRLKKKMLVHCIH